MSMNGVYRQVSPRALAVLEEQPELAGAALDWMNADSTMLRENPALAGMMDDEDEEFEGFEALRAAGITDADLPATVDILKTFHGLHFLLAGTPWEPGPGAGQAVFGGREIGEEVVYGPARVMSVAETAEVAAALAAVTEGELAARYDADAMRAAEIYGAWNDLEWLLESFRQVRDYYAAARDRGYGMLLAIV